MGCLLLSDEKANLLLLDENTNALALVMDLHPMPSPPHLFCLFMIMHNKFQFQLKNHLLSNIPNSVC